MEEVKRETLYEEVWREPMTKVAIRYGVSSNYLARVCENLNVPRPPRGYWAKLAVGKAPRQPPLPQALVSDHPMSSGDDRPTRTQSEALQPTRSRAKATRRTGMHPLLSGTKPLFLKGRTHDSGLLKPSKRLLPDLIVSERTLDEVLALGNELYNRLEDAGHHVVLAPRGQRFSGRQIEVRDFDAKQDRYRSLWMPDRATIASVDRVAIGLAIFEITEEIEVQYMGDGKYIPVADLPKGPRARAVPSWSWTSKQERPSGRFCILTYCPYSTAKWERRWHAKSPSQWSSTIGELVASAPQIALEIAELVRQGDLAAEARRREWDEQCREREQKYREEQFRQATIKSIDELKDIIHAWSERKAIREFFDAADRDLITSHAIDVIALTDRVARAREFIGDNDPLEQLLNWKTPEERVLRSATSGAAAPSRHRSRIEEASRIAAERPLAVTLELWTYENSSRRSSIQRRRPDRLFELSASDTARVAGRQWALKRPMPWDPSLEALWERGFRHERDHVEQLATTAKRLIRIEGVDIDDASVGATLEAMHSGADVIVQAALRSGGWIGRADILQRVQKSSALGGWSYEVYDTKLARETKANTILQLCLYSDLLETMQGTAPDRMHVVAPWTDFVPQTFRVAEYAAYYRLIRQGLIAATGALRPAETYPTPDEPL